MDNFLSLAKEGYKAYQHSQNPDVNQTGGQEYNSPDNNRQQGGQRPNYNHDEVVHAATGHGNGDPSMYRNALGYVNDNQGEHHDPVDERRVQDAHDQAYNQGGASNLSPKDLGGAAALQALKSFTSGGGSGGSGGSGGGSTTQLISLAMAEASKLFDKSGSSGNKQDAVNGAAMTVMKLLVQSKFNSTTGGSNSGGLGSLMGLASKFM